MTLIRTSPSGPTVDVSDDIADAEFVLTAPNALLPNSRVADDSTEIDLSLGVGLVSWFLKTASVAFSKLVDLSGLSVLGRSASSSGVMAAITASAGSQKLVSNAAGTALQFVSDLSVQFDDTVTGTLDPYLLPAAFKSGDSLVWVITGNVTLNRMRLSDDSIPPDGFVVNLSLRDQSGGSAPGFSITIVDTGAVTVNGSFRPPGQIQGTSPGPSYVMQSEEEGCILVIRAGNWRLLGGTAGQAIDGVIAVPSGNGGTRTSTFGTAAANTVLVNPTAGTLAPVFTTIGTNTVLGRVGANIVAAALVNAQVSASAAIAVSKLANALALSILGRSANSGGAYADIQATAASDAVLRESGSVVGFGTVAQAGLADSIISPAKLAVLASSVGSLFTIYASFAAGAGGAPDDVTVFNANAPFAFRILKTLPYVATPVAVSTLRAFSATGGGGTALSSLFAATLATEDPAITTSITATATVAANGSYFIRRSDSGIAGEWVLLAVRT